MLSEMNQSTPNTTEEIDKLDLETHTPARRKSLFSFDFKKTSSKILLIGVLFVLAAGTMASLYLLQYAQDLRQQASVEGGLVQVSSSQTSSSGTTFPVGQPVSIPVQVNTNGVQVDGVQLSFNIVTDVTESITIAPVEGSGLKEAITNVTPNSSGFSVQSIFIGESVTAPFSSTQPTTFFNLEFTPTQTGNVQLVFDQTKSYSTVNKSDPPKDELAPVVTMNFTIITQMTGTPTATVGQSTGTKICGESCQTTADCANSTGGAPIVCQNNKCVNINCPNDTQDGTICNCKTSIGRCGEPCGKNQLPTCIGTGSATNPASECGFIGNVNQCSESIANNQFCLPKQPQNGYTRNVCSGVQAYNLRRPDGSNVTTQEQVMESCFPQATGTPVPTSTFTPVPTATFTPVPTATFTPVPTATFTSTPTPGTGGTTATATPTKTNTPTVTPTKTNTPTPSATLAPGTTATSTPVPLSCNQSCSANSQCQSTLICFQGRCRNPQNTGNQQCQAPGNTATSTNTPQPTSPALPAAGGTGNVLIMTGVGVTVLLLGALAVFLLL